jgi:uncharacterized OB-fold protein
MPDAAKVVVEDELALIAGSAVVEDADGSVRLVGGACSGCGLRMFPRAPVCPACMSEDVAEEVMSDAGTLYAYTIVHVGPAKWRKPLAVGYVDLPNGVRVFAHLRGDLAIGRRMVLAADVVAQTPDGRDVRNFVFAEDAA